MIRIVVYLKQDYSQADSFLIIDTGKVTKEQITEMINEKYKEWYYYDIF